MCDVFEMIARFHRLTLLIFLEHYILADYDE